MSDHDELAALIRTEVLAHDGFYDDPGFIDAAAWPAVADAILARWRLVPVDAAAWATLEQVENILLCPGHDFTGHQIKIIPNPVD
jgi:hypothetical protein